MISNHDDLINNILDSISVSDLLDTLTPKERDTIVLWLYEGYKHSEVAKIIKIRYNDNENLNGDTIGARIQTIILKLRQQIDPTYSKRSTRISKSRRKIL